MTIVIALAPAAEEQEMKAVTGRVSIVREQRFYLITDTGQGWAPHARA